MNGRLQVQVGLRVRAAVLCAGLFALSLQVAAEPSGGLERRAGEMAGATWLQRARDELWQTLVTRFFDRRTEMIYDVLWQGKDGKVSATACLPSPEEVTRQFPNPCAWGTGMQDCVFNGAPFLAVAMKRGDREMVRAIYRGLRRCATVSGVKGFVARGVHPEDGKSFYSNSSRDTWTLFVFYMRRLLMSEFSDEAMRQEIRGLLVDVAAYAEQCVKPENGYALLRADGKRSIVSQMWVAEKDLKPRLDAAGWDHFGGLCSHEALRLPMIYAVADEVSGDKRWRDLKECYIDAALTMAEGHIGADIRASILNQMQLSTRLLWEIEGDPGRKARLWKLLNRAADIAAHRVTTRLEKLFGTSRWQVSRPMRDWHGMPFKKGGFTLDGCRYDVPDQRVATIEDCYVEAAHAVLVQAMVDGRSVDARSRRLLLDALKEMDLSSVACSNAVNALLALYLNF